MKTIEEIRNDVAFSYGYINWEGFKDELRKRPTILLDRNLEFDKIIDQVAKEYSKETERYYEGDTDCSCNWNEISQEGYKQGYGDAVFKITNFINHNL